jgi:glycosyltransferase involved in cell wall biosynthesis
LNDEELCRTFGKTGRELIENKYDWNKVWKQIEGIYQKCIDEY